MNMDNTLAGIRAQWMSAHKWATDFLSVYEKPIDAILKATAKINVIDSKIDYGSKTFDLFISGSKHDLEAVWGALRKQGLTTDKDRPTKEATSWSGFFSREGDEFRVYLGFVSTVCRRIKTGTKMVEQDVFETVCGEMVIP